MLTAEQIMDKARICAADWTSRDPDRVALHYAEDAVSDMNDAARLEGRAALREMAAGFIADFPDLQIHLNECRPAGNRALFLWTLTGTHRETGNKVELPGWEDWTLNDAGEIAHALGRYDAEDYERQVGA